MKQNLKTLLGIIVMLAICCGISFFLPAFVVQGIILFILVCMLAAIGTSNIKDTES